MDRSDGDDRRQRCLQHLDTALDLAVSTLALEPGRSVELKFQKLAVMEKRCNRFKADFVVLHQRVEND